MILYEYPFNERIRTYLRLEHLFRRLSLLVPRDHPVDHHYALATIFEVMDVGARADLKSDVMKDLDKQKQALNGYRGNPAIAEQVLDDVVGKLDGCFATLNNLPGKAGQTTPGSIGRRRHGASTWSGGRRRWPRWQNRFICCSGCCATPAYRRK